MVVLGDEGTPPDPQAVIAALTERIAEYEARIAYLERVADTDCRTGILNRRAFEAELLRAMQLAAEYETPISLIYIDIENLENVNQRLGIAAAEVLLRDGADDVLGALGGSDFGIIVNQSDRESAEELAASLAQRLAARTVVADEVVVTAKPAWGVHRLVPGESAEAAIHAAAAARRTEPP